MGHFPVEFGEEYLLTTLHFSQKFGADAEQVELSCQAHIEMGDVKGQMGDREIALKHLEDAELIANSRDDLKIYKRNISAIRKELKLQSRILVTS